MNEYEMIRRIAEGFPKSARQHNEPFTCDAELVEIGGRLWGLTLDEFTPQEDLFTSEDPEVLGANLVTATLSDLLAAGCNPEFFMHAVSLPKDVEPKFIDSFSKGVRSTLESSGAFLCGGDIGTAAVWRFCGFAMGPVPKGKGLTHLIPDGEQDLWITGSLGDANFAALTKSPTPRFELRMREAKLARRYGTSCIDTSGGFLDAVWLLHVLNPVKRFELQLDKLPMASGILEFARSSGFPEGAALLAGAGEYELLFTTPKDARENFHTRFADLEVTHIGEVLLGSKPGIYMFGRGDVERVMSEPPPCPREAKSVEEHVLDVKTAAEKLFGK